MYLLLLFFLSWNKLKKNGCNDCPSENENYLNINHSEINFQNSALVLSEGWDGKNKFFC